MLDQLYYCCCDVRFYSLPLVKGPWVCAWATYSRSTLGTYRANWSSPSPGKRVSGNPYVLCTCTRSCFLFWKDLFLFFKLYGFFFCLLVCFYYPQIVFQFIYLFVFFKLFFIFNLYFTIHIPIPALHPPADCSTSHTSSPPPPGKTRLGPTPTPPDPTKTRGPH